MKNLNERASKWLTSHFDKDTNNTVKDLIIKNDEVFYDSFYKDLEFGTGGMRGIMGVGTNRINKYTLGKNTQGISNYLKKTFPNQEIRVAIAYDCRNNSETLGKDVANVFSSNGIKVFLFSELRPTPELSFTVRHLKCHCGIVLTASHNPPKYNGYKVYWNDGAQVVPPIDSEIIKAIGNVDFKDILFSPKKELIEYIGRSIDDIYIDKVVNHVCLDQKDRSQIKIVFTPLHGTSITLMPQIFERAGFNQVHIIKEQSNPDGNFSTVTSPNPEEPSALAKALQKAEDINADIVIATDPDADRLGVAVRNLEGKLVLLNGNQTMLLLTDYLLNAHKKTQTLNDKKFIASTVVSTPIMKKMALDYGVAYRETLTGFKWIGELIENHSDLEFVGGGEESFGYLTGTFVRDKDALISTLLVCEACVYYKSKNHSLYKKLLDIYTKYDYYQDKLVSLVKKGAKGNEEIKTIISNFRTNPPMALNGAKLISFYDYLHSKIIYFDGRKEENIVLPKENLLIVNFDDETRIAVRPSGTEPKIKFYITVKKTLDKIAEIELIKSNLNHKIEQIIKTLKIK